MDTVTHAHVCDSDAFDHRVNALAGQTPYVALVVRNANDRGSQLVLFIDSTDVLTSLIETARAARTELVKAEQSRPSNTASVSSGGAA